MKTPKRQASNQRRTLASIRKKVTELSRDWDDVDGFFQNRLSWLADQIEEIEKEFKEYIEDPTYVPF